jgi:metal-dependent hydrolase (beta-lactamase superfamily II)
MHLVKATRRRMDQTVDGLRRLNVHRLGPMHCTGTAATAALWSRFRDRCFPCPVGTTLEFERS